MRGESRGGLYREIGTDQQFRQTENVKILLVILICFENCR
jgi:hypothetical protein